MTQPHSPLPLRLLRVPGAAGAKANSWQPHEHPAPRIRAGAPRCSPSAKSSTSRWTARPSRLPGQRMVAKAAETAPIAIERHTQIVLLTNELIFVNRSQRNAGNPARSSAQFGRIKIMPANDHRSRVEHATRVLFPATRRERFAACDQTRKIINLCGRRSSADSALCPSSFPEIHPHSSSRLCAFA